jgi:ABC-2 type transport system permease protein
VQNAADPGQVQRELNKPDSAYSFGLVLPAGLETQLTNLQHPSVYLYFNPQLLGDSFQKYVTNNVSQYLHTIADQNPPFLLSISVAPVTTATAESTVSKLAGVLDDPQNLNGLGQSSVVVFLGIFLALNMTPEIVIEEKERRTMQMLLTSPASPLDVVIAKSLLGIIYVVLAALPVIALSWGVYHNPLPVAGFILLTLIFGVGLGLLVGAVFDNNKAAQIWASLVAILAIGPGVVGLLLDDTVVGAALRWWPTYPMFSGIRDAASDTISLGGGLLGMTFSLAYIALAFVSAAFLLRHRITHR